MVRGGNGEVDIDGITQLVRRVISRDRDSFYEYWFYLVLPEKVKGAADVLFVRFLFDYSPANVVIYFL